MDNNQDKQVKPLENNTDWFLQILVNFSNGIEGSSVFPITLNVGGVLVSGEMVPGDEYFKGFAENLKTGGLPEKFANEFESLGEIYVKQRAVPGNEEQETELPPSPQYIHLKNAHIFHPGGKAIPTNMGVWWRGKISAVDGFMLGTLSVE